jgi:hypothetical protein
MILRTNQFDDLIPTTPAASDYGDSANEMAFDGLSAGEMTTDEL